MTHSIAIPIAIVIAGVLISMAMRYDVLNSASDAAPTPQPRQQQQNDCGV